MEARKIKPEEHIDALKIISIAFRRSKDFSCADKEPEEFYNGYETVRAFFNDDNKMCAAMEISPFKISFEGRTTDMAGIGGVVTLPEERNKGYIRRLFQYCFKEMRENKQWLSFLYPFSSEYYRKYGYETSAGKVKYTIPLASFKHFTNSGKLKLYIPGTDDSYIRQIYGSYIAERNLAVRRSDILWNRHIGEDPYKNNIYTYVWYDSKEEPKGYITFKCQKRQDFGANMLIKELVWLNNEAFIGILSFLGDFTPNYRDFIWETTEYHNLGLFFPDSSCVKTELYNFGMCRIVDLEEVLKLRGCPEGEGTLVFEVVDNFLEWNNGCFEVSWNKEGVKVVKKICSPDLSCSIQTLTQLITGYVSLEDLIWSEDLKIIGNRNLLSSYFKRKLIYLNERF